MGLGIHNLKVPPGPLITAHRSHRNRLISHQSATKVRLHRRPHRRPRRPRTQKITIVRQIKKKKDYYEILGVEKSCTVEIFGSYIGVTSEADFDAEEIFGPSTTPPHRLRLWETI
ncbi:hypothetical protein CFP56_026811 [Quercus suber]|uniref:Uncharacterized protein n=1 Tax=Quercus suber TaxID=58331 RepID=A0AAW0K112_QUESU